MRRRTRFWAVIGLALVLLIGSSPAAWAQPRWARGFRGGAYRAAGIRVGGPGFARGRIYRRGFVGYPVHRGYRYRYRSRSNAWPAFVGGLLLGYGLGSAGIGPGYRYGYAYPGYGYAPVYTTGYVYPRYGYVYPGYGYAYPTYGYSRGYGGYWYP